MPDYDNLVPNEQRYWYYHEPTKLLLRHRPGYGWRPVRSLPDLDEEVSEMKEAVGLARERGFYGVDAFERLLAWEEAVEAASD